METTDFYVTSGSPSALDATLQALPGVRAFVIGGPGGPFVYDDDGNVAVRVFGGDSANRMFKFMVENQGYCTVVGERVEA